MPVSGRDFLRSLDHEEYYGSFIKVVAPDGTEFNRRNILHNRGVDGRTQDWQIHFWWHWDTSYEANWGIIRIFGLDNNKIRKFTRGGQVKLLAGWQRRHENSILSLDGTIIFVGDYKRNDIHRGTEIFFVDSPKNTNIITNRAWKPGTLYSTRFNDLLGDISMGAEVNNPYLDDIYKDGCSTFGRAYDSMRETANDMKSKFYVYNNKVRLLPHGEGINPDDALILRADQIDKIKRIYVSQESPRTGINVLGYEHQMVKVKMALEPKLNPDIISDLSKISMLDLSEKGYTDAEIGSRRAIKGTTWSDENHFHTEALLVPVGGGYPEDEIIIAAADSEQADTIQPKGGGTNPGQAMEDLWGFLDDLGIDADGFMEFFEDLPFFDEVKEFFDETIDDLIDKGINYALDQGLDMAKGFVGDALASVGIPAPAIFAGIDAVGKLASGDIAGALGTLADGAMDSIPGIGVAKTIAGMAAPFFTGD